MKTRLLLLIIAAGFATALSGCKKDTPEPQTELTVQTYIEDVVSGTYRTESGVTVRVFNETGEVTTAETDENGVAVFKNLEAGTYYVTAEYYDADQDTYYESAPVSVVITEGESKEIEVILTA
ncbi:MAG: hypothetical protein GXO27_01520 [Chlorobi bacterium]|nr:hypothetical protein [Chlorobiota bacterium]